MASRDILAPCLGAALLGGMLVQACDHDLQAHDRAVNAAVNEAIGNGVAAEALTRDSARVVLLFTRDGCNVYRFTDSYGAHYLAAREAENAQTCALGH